jgi:lipoprotein-releasing system permease protein
LIVTVSPNLRIALRFIIAKKRSMAMSLAGIVFGVSFFIVAQAQTSGFENFFIRTILGTNGALRIEDQVQDTLRTIEVDDGRVSDASFSFTFGAGRRYVAGVQNPVAVADAAMRFDNVRAVAQVLRGNIEMTNTFKSEPVQLFGIEIDRHLQVSDLADQIVFGDLDEFRRDPNSIMVGADLADRMLIQPGDTVLVRALGQNYRARVAAIYETGIRDVDVIRVFGHLQRARTILQRPFGTSFLQVALHDEFRARQDAPHMQSVLGHHVASWQERERAWLEAFRALRVSSAISVSAIIMIAGLGMFNTLAIIVMEKTKEIAILRSMGYTRRDVGRIFLWQGFLITTVGTLLGWVVAAVLTGIIERLPIRIRGIFSTDSFVVDWSFSHYLTAAAIAFVIVMIATTIPSRRAAQLEPGDVIRGTSA